MCLPSWWFQKATISFLDVLICIPGHLWQWSRLWRSCPQQTFNSRGLLGLGGTLLSQGSYSVLNSWKWLNWLDFVSFNTKTKEVKMCWRLKHTYYLWGIHTRLSFLWCTFPHCWSSATCSKHNIQAWQCHGECFNLCGSRIKLKLATRSGCFAAKVMCAVFKQLSLVITHQYRSKVLIKAGFIPFIQPSLLSQLNLTTLGNEQVCFICYKLKRNSSSCSERTFTRSYFVS